MPIEVTKLIVKSTLLEPQSDSQARQPYPRHELQQLKQDILQECQRLLQQAQYEQRPR
ncbi:hypothetical protein HRH59_14680 [Rheinheimera sp. YQF-2]|jgi:hypothetical protein|uniref:Uncharacterized protein n=1 Tax=Rheinheimera lutimaris TaxID=2740584 RepID=A0A7Y5ASM1_9GAMM|nr:DUF5908 family protein [Rheinheimera lutimaris]NRQ43797.1 hypothetical protein [Rheinheimera lutimaris]